MKKVLALLALITLLFTIGASPVVFAQEDTSKANDTTVTASTTEEVPATVEDEEATEQEQSLHKQVKQLFIEGGPLFMSSVLITFILGLALVIERIIYLNLATTNNKKLLSRIEAALEQGGVEAAKDVCRNTRGPVASIFYQGIDRYEEGIDIVEKSVVSYGGVQMGLLEKGLSWISLMISIAPMLGFLGTVIGMIDAFTSIQAMGDIRPDVVAGGIKVALITTVGGLIVAIILQVFYNYLVSKIDSLVNSMEDASISLIDILVKYQHKSV